MKVINYAFGLMLTLIGLCCQLAGANNPTPPERITTLLDRMQTLHQARNHQELIDRFANEDIAGWPEAGSAQAARALHLRGQAYQRLNDLERAAADLAAAVARAPDNGYYWQTLGVNLRNRGDEAGALQAFLNAYEHVAAAHTGVPRGWMPASATLSAATILRDQGRYAEALDVLDRYGNETVAAMGYWGEGLLRARAQVYAGQGRDREALDLFRLANRLQAERGK